MTNSLVPSPSRSPTPSPMPRMSRSSLRHTFSVSVDFDLLFGETFFEPFSVSLAPRAKSRSPDCASLHVETFPVLPRETGSSRWTVRGDP